MKSPENPALLQPVLERLAVLFGAPAISSTVSPEHHPLCGRMTPHQTVCTLTESPLLPIGGKEARKASGIFKRTVLKFGSPYVPIPRQKSVPTLPEPHRLGGVTPPIEFHADRALPITLPRGFAPPNPALEWREHPLKQIDPMAADGLGISAHGSSSKSVRSVNMQKIFRFAALSAWLLTPSAHAETGSFTIHMILHAIGEERYEIAQDGATQVLNTSSEYSDRGMKRTTEAQLRMTSDYTPITYGAATPLRKVSVTGAKAEVQEGAANRTADLPARYFTVFGPSPFAIQMAMMRYWLAHGKPAQLIPVRAGTAAQAIEIVLAGHDSITVNGKSIVLDRYNIANLMFGHEILWMNAAGQLAAAMTFAGGLPMEAVRTEYEPALAQLYRAGVAQQMANLAALALQAPSERSGTFAIAGATLIDSTGRAPVADSVVIVRDGRIAAAGPQSTVPIPRGVAVVDGKGKTILPGLWEMHTHFSGVEFGPALLAAGITTARDCGGEFDYLVAQRDAAAKGAVSPRLLLAGLVDAGGLKAFGHVTAETPEEGRAVVRRYHDAGFEQIKLYTFLTPDVVRAIASEAHRLSMTVTGHVPQALNAFEGVEAGMDQINHLNYATNMMRAPGAGRGPVDLNSDVARNAIRFFKDHHTVIDPTAGWGEMAGHSVEVDVAAFEPGILKAPFVLDAKFRGMAGNTTAEQMHARLAQTEAAIGALFKAGVPIVPGSDTGLVGYGLQRELEIYVEAGMTPMEAIQSATIVSARAMKLDRELGTIEPGKRADLILVDGNRPAVRLRQVVGERRVPPLIWLLSLVPQNLHRLESRGANRG
jgi:imidazolonepropionase-like amidohydrolase